MHQLLILGTHGIPADFGGFETFAEQLSVRLVKHGVPVTVFCEARCKCEPLTYNGVTLRYHRTPSVIGLRSIWFDFVTLIAASRTPGVIYMLGYHSAFLYFIPRLFRRSLWINMDGIEWKRAKWSWLARIFLRIMERMAIYFSTTLIADADAMRTHLISKGAVPDKIRVIPYGALVIDEPPNIDVLERLGLTPGEYYLVVCRLEPENHVLELIQGYLSSGSARPLALVGDHRAKSRYVEKLRRTGNQSVLWLGTIYDVDILSSIRYYCSAYLHGHSVGGTNPSLLEAMGAGNYIIAHDNAFNREVTNHKAAYFRSQDDVAAYITQIEKNGTDESVREYYRSLIRAKYNWEKIADTYFRELCNSDSSHSE